MRNSASNMIEDGIAILGPETSMADLVKFTSLLQSLSVRGGLQKESIQTASWTSMGFKEEKKESAFFSPNRESVFGFDAPSTTVKSKKRGGCVSCCIGVTKCIVCCPCYMCGCI